MIKEEKMKQYPKAFQQFRADYPGVLAAYEELGESAATAGPLDAKTLELIKLGMAAAGRSQSAVQSHTHRALEAGAKPAEVEHALVAGVNTLGFSTMMAALSRAKSALDNHEP
jgi:4-carboxymuconolactone decarboxylase